MVARLKINIEEHYSLFKGRKAVLEPVNNFSGNILSNPDLARMIFEQIDAGNYTQCARLFKELFKAENLREGAFIAGSLLERMMQQVKKAPENSMRMQCLLMAYQYRVMGYQRWITGGSFELDETCRQIIKTITTHMGKHLETVNALIEQAFKKRDAADKLVDKAAADTDNKDLLTFAKLHLASADKAIEAACQAVEAAKMVAQASAEVCKQSGFYPELVSKCTEEITKHIALLSETIKEIGKQDSSALSETLKVNKQLFMAFIQARQENAPDNKQAQLATVSESIEAEPSVSKMLGELVMHYSELTSEREAVINMLQRGQGSHHSALDKRLPELDQRIFNIEANIQREQQTALVVEEKKPAKGSSANNQSAFFPPSISVNALVSDRNLGLPADASSSYASSSFSPASHTGNHISISPFVAEIVTTLLKIQKVLTVEQAPLLKEKLQRLFNSDPNKDRVNKLSKCDRQALAQRTAEELQTYVNELRTGNGCDGEFTSILSEECVVLAKGQKQVPAGVV